MEKDRREFLKKMRNPRADALQKSATMKKVRDKCKLSCCPAVITKMVSYPTLSIIILPYECHY